MEYGAMKEKRVWRLLWVWGFIPVLVFAIRQPKAGDAMARGFFIQVARMQWHNHAIVQHELVHVRQFWRSLMLHGLLYNMWGWYRLHAEAEAYAEQLRWIPRAEFDQALSEFAGFLATMYRLNTNKAYTELLIRVWWDKHPAWYV